MPPTPDGPQLAAISSASCASFVTTRDPVVAVGSGEAGIDGEDDTISFGRVVDAALLSDGFVVADGFLRRLVFFGESGEPRATVGREGGGPGEFGDIELTAVVHDTVRILDRRNRRWTLLTVNGEVIRTEPIRPVRSDGAAASLAGAVGPFDDGSIVLVRQLARADPIDGVARYRDTLELEWFTAEGRSLGIVGRFAGNDRVVEIGQTFNVSTPPFGRTVAFAGLRQWLLVGSTDAPAVEVYRLDGSRVGEVPLPDRSVELSAGLLRARISGLPEGSSDRARLERVLEAEEYPERTPRFSGVVMVDRADRLWVRAYDLPGDTVLEYLNVSTSGAVLETFAMPAGYHVVDADDNRVLTIHRDELGVQSVHLFTRECTSGG